MHNPGGELADLRGWVSSAEEATTIRRALRARLVGVPLGDGDRASLDRGIALFERALRATFANTPPTRATAAFTGDAQALAMLRGNVSGSFLVERTKLQRLRDVLKRVHDQEDVDNNEVAEAIDLFAKLNARALDCFRRASVSDFIIPES